MLDRTIKQNLIHSLGPRHRHTDTEKVNVLQARKADKGKSLMAKQEIVDEQNFEEVSASLNQLHFFPQNPRREPLADEDAIRAVLCQEEGGS